MKILVTFYSRTGNTRKIGNEIAEKLKADADEVVDKKPRGGVKGYLFAGRDAMKKKLAEIEYRKDPAEYDLVIIGIPVWAGMTLHDVWDGGSRHQDIPLREQLQERSFLLLLRRRAVEDLRRNGEPIEKAVEDLGDNVERSNQK